MSKSLLFVFLVWSLGACNGPFAIPTEVQSLLLPNDSLLLQNSSGISDFEVGGSNYISWHIGPLGGNPTKDSRSALDFMHVIYTYHHNPIVVRDQIHTMCNNGQKKISLMIWFTQARWMETSEWNNAYGSITNSRGGTLSPQISANLRNLLMDLKETKDSFGLPCFNEVFFRFAPWSVSTALSWGDQWNESMYLENRRFIFSTRAIVEDLLGTTSIKRTYDLGAEEGGLTDVGQMKIYGKRLWQDYISNYGDSDTYGYSVAVFENRGWRLLEIFDQVGKRPQQYALDVYSIQGFEDVLSELKANGESQKPIVIQETFYNDRAFVEKIFEAANKYGFRIRTIMQWPKSFDSDDVEYSEVFPAAYSNNLPTPSIGGAGLGCDDGKCIWLQGSNFSNGCRIDIYDVNGGRLSDPQSVFCLDNYATFRIADDVYSKNDRIGVVVVNKFNKWNSPTFVSTR